MERPDYLENYLFDWDLLDVIVGGKSALDSQFFSFPVLNAEQVNNFLKAYGLDPEDPINRAELFGNFQEAMQFIRRYFLREGNTAGIDLTIPAPLYMITDVSDLFLMATGQRFGSEREEQLWAEIILKVMHTILHVDKDLRSNYFSNIQTQIFDRFYKYIHRDDDNALFLGLDGKHDKIKLVDFETKSKKSRESVIIKLLHKTENVAEELFDRVGVRFVTETKFDAIRVINHLVKFNVIIPHNIKPSRSVNSLVDLNELQRRYQSLLKVTLRNKLSEERFLNAVEREISDIESGRNEKNRDERNLHTSKSYKSLQFTCRQLIKYKNPFLHEFNDLRKSAKASGEEDPLAKKILSLDLSLIAKDIRFFYPYEVQVVDAESHKQNSEGDASHQEYKKSQVISAMDRVFKSLIDYKKFN